MTTSFGAKVASEELERLIRPEIRVEIVETRSWQPWDDVFAVYHYLKGAPHMPFSTTFTGFDIATGDPVCFCGVTGIWSGQRRCARACRLVVHPEWQGAGIGMRFLNTVCQRELEGVGFIGQPVPTYFHTAAPALCSALRRDPRWRQVSQKLVGDKVGRVKNELNMKYGGHDRAVAGFRYEGAK